jgi:hypothetical protein
MYENPLNGAPKKIHQAEMTALTNKINVTYIKGPVSADQPLFGNNGNYIRVLILFAVYLERQTISW